MTAGIDIPDRRGVPAWSSTAATSSGGIASEGEDIAVVELPFTRALAMTRAGQLADAKTIMLLQWAALDGPFRRL